MHLRRGTGPRIVIGGNSWRRPDAGKNALQERPARTPWRLHMSLRQKRLGVVLLTAALAFAVTTDAQARFGGGGGGGGMRFSPSHIGSFRPGAGAFTARSFPGRSFTGINRGSGARPFAGNVGHSVAGRNIGRAAVGAGALGAGHFVNHAFAHNNWNHQPFHGSFPRPYPGFRGWYGYGWYGPVFWPFAYDILFADLFWPWAYDYPFWA